MLDVCRYGLNSSKAASAPLIEVEFLEESI